MTPALAFIATILFGTPGPVQTMQFTDGSVRVEVRYRMAQDRRRATGPARVYPTVASGTLAVRYDGRRRTFDLTRIFPIRGAYIGLSRNPVRDGCGMTQTLTRRDRYLAIEAVAGGKGCAPLAAFIDLPSGIIVERAILDRAWYHRFDANGDRFTGVPVRVTGVERVTLEKFSYASESTAPARVPWPFAIVHTRDSAGRTAIVAYETADSGASNGASDVPDMPAIGSSVRIGTDDESLTNLPFWHVLRLDERDEQRYAAMQTPTPARLERTVRRNSWFDVAEHEAFIGNMPAAVSAYAKMLAYEDDPELRASERGVLARCDALLRAVQAHRLSPAAASARFNAGCSPPRSSR